MLFMLSDDEIATALDPLRPLGYGKVPIEGSWSAPPFADRVVDDRTMAVVCEDVGISALLVDRGNGQVWIIDPDGSGQLVNRSLQQLVECSRLYQDACREVDSVTAGGFVNNEKISRAIAAKARTRFEQVDPDAVRGPNQLWSVFIEELGYGM